MCCKQHNAPDLRAAGMFNLSVIPDWETISSAQRRLTSLDHLREEVNPQALNLHFGRLRLSTNLSISRIMSQSDKCMSQYDAIVSQYDSWHSL